MKRCEITFVHSSLAEALSKGSCGLQIPAYLLAPTADTKTPEADILRKSAAIRPRIGRNKAKSRDLAKMVAAARLGGLAKAKNRRSAHRRGEKAENAGQK